MQTFCGSPCYCAPECLSWVQYDGRLSDIWSLGVILYSMVTGEHPWNVSNTSMMLKQIMTANYELPDYLSSEIKDLITSLIRIKPSDRLPLHLLLKHPWLNFSEWALVNPPQNLDLNISSIKLQPKTLEQLSSSSSRSSHMSDHGIVSPFDFNSDNGNSTDEDEPISLSAFSSPSLGKIKQLSASMNRLATKHPVRRRYVQQPISSRGKMAKIFIPQIESRMTVIKEVPQENAKP